MLETIDKHQMVHEGDKIVVGLSGGPDSLAMLHALYHFRKTLKIELIAVHINHMFRGKFANDDEAFVKAFCKSYEIPVFSYRIDVSEYAKEVGTSFEDAGRRIRYQYFQKVKVAENAQKIAVAHNRNDLIETFFINLFRGSGIDGLSSIDYKRDDVYIRPLLDVSREEIESYCMENELSPRRDHTNDENNYLRNRIRNELLPSLRQSYNPGLDATLYKTIQLMKNDKEFWQVHTEKLFNDCCKRENNSVRIDKNKFDALQEAERLQLMRLSISHVKGNLKNISLDLVRRACTLRQTGTVVYLDVLHQVRMTYDELFVEKINEKDKPDPIPELYTKQISKDQYLKIRGRLDFQNTVALDVESVEGSVSLRHRKNGDVFNPLGMRGHKKLKDFLIDEKIPQSQRDKLWIVCDEHKILWVHPLRMCESCKITEETENILLISFIDIVEVLELC